MSVQTSEGPPADVLLINPPYPRRHAGGLVPPIGLCYLAATLREAGANAQILDVAALFPDYMNGNTEPVEEVIGYLDSCPWPPRMIGVGPLVTATLRPTRDILAACRDHTDAQLVVGGALSAVPGMSSVVNTYLDADAYVAGDGETPIREIWRAVAEGQALPSGPGIGLRGGPEPSPYREENLDVLALPARDLLSNTYRASARREIGGSGLFTSAFLSRGCPYSCTFCAAPLASGKQVRRLSRERISDELKSCAELGYTDLIFYDDCLFIRSPRLNHRVLEFCDAAESSGWRGTYQMELRCDAVVSLSDEALRALTATGCRQINMGIEKAHTSQLALLEKRLTPDVAREACERLSSSGIRGAGTFILGGVEESPRILEETVEFALSLPLDFAHFNPLAVYPGTALYEQVFPRQTPDSWLFSCLDAELAPRGDILWRSRELPLKLILESIRIAYGSFYTTERLSSLLTKVPPAEAGTVQASYRTLARDRGLSWSAAVTGSLPSGSALPAVPDPC